MKRKDFLSKGLAGLGSIVSISAVMGACASGDEVNPVSSDTTESSSSSSDSTSSSSSSSPSSGSSSCTLSPSETEGPYPIKSPSSYVRANIVGDRTGVAMTLTINVKDISAGCESLAGVLVDVWHCDKDGNYSQYNSYSSANFLRGRQTTDANGQAVFTSIFPGWYRGRAPHIHIEILTASGSSLLVSQIAFPVAAYTAVYASSSYNGAPDTSNSQDSIFRDSLDRNMADSASGSVSAGYNVVKTIIVA